MSYSISLNSHGPDPDDVREVFETTVRALRAIAPAGSPPVYGSLTAEGISLNAESVADVTEPADAEDGELPGADDPNVQEEPTVNPQEA